MRAAPAARILPTGAPQQKQLFCGEEGGCGGEVWGWFGVVGEKWRVAVVGTGDGVWLCKRPRPVGWTCQRPDVRFPVHSIPKNHTHRAPAFLYNPCVP